MEHIRREQQFVSGKYSSGYIPAKDTYVFGDGTKVCHAYYENQWAARGGGRSNAVYVDGEREITTEGLQYTIRGEDPEMDKRWDAHNRQVIAAMREVLDYVRSHVEFSQLPDNLQHVLSQRLPFDRYAGCSCPCSPGFKVRGADNTVHMGIKGTIRIVAPHGFADREA